MSTPNQSEARESLKHPSARTPLLFQWRALASVVITLSFLALAISGGVLWAAPPGRIANWTDWAMLGLRKSEWINLHIWFSLLFLATSVFHLILNWRPLLSYFRNRITHRFGWRREWLAGAILCAALFAAVRLHLPPFSTFLAFTDDLREIAVNNGYQKPNELIHIIRGN